MEELLKNEVVRKKIKSLSPAVRRSFIENLLDLYEQETEDMIDVIEESRLELRGDYMTFTGETQALRAESRMLEERRREYEDECVERYLRKKGMSSRSSDSNLSYIDEKTNSKAVDDYIRKRGKRRPKATDGSARSVSTVSDTVPENRSVSSMSTLTTRSLPTPISVRSVEEEKDAVMKNLSTANQHAEAERQRQVELIQQRREKRRQQKQTTEEKALELLEKALEMDKQLAVKKKEQDQKVKNRLEDMKRKKEKERTVVSMRADEDSYDFGKY